MQGIDTKFQIILIFYNTKLATKPDGVFLNRKIVHQRLLSDRGIKKSQGCVDYHLRTLLKLGILSRFSDLDANAPGFPLDSKPSDCRITPAGSKLVRRWTIPRGPFR